MKKFFDFECITIMVMAILFGPIYWMYFNIQEFQQIISKEIGLTEEQLINIGIGIFGIVNFIYFGIKIAKLISDYSDLLLYKNKEKEIGKIEPIEIEKYDLVLGSFVFYKCFSINRLVSAYKKYYKEKGFLVNGSIEENCVDKLTEIEKGMILMCADDVKLEDDDPMNLEDRCMNTLIEKKLVKYNSIAKRVTKFCEGEDGKYKDVDYEKNPRIAIIAAIVFILMGIILKILGVYVAAIILPIIAVIFVFNSNKIVLSEAGRIERIRILNLIELLEKKDDLTEKEKLFLEIMKK